MPKSKKPTNNELLIMIKGNYENIGTINQSINLVAQTLKDFIDSLGKEEEFTKFLKQRYKADDHKKTDDK